MYHAPFYLKLSQDDSWYMDRPHFHESVEFLLPVSHGGQMFVENQVYDLAPATMFILPDATLHKTLGNEDGECCPYERYVLHVPLSTLHIVRLWLSDSSLNSLLIIKVCLRQIL